MPVVSSSPSPRAFRPSFSAKVCNVPRLHLLTTKHALRNRVTVTRTPEGHARDSSVGVGQTLHFGGSCFGPSAPELADEVTPLSNNLEGCWGKRHRALGFKDGRVVEKVSRPRSRALERSTHHNHHKQQRNSSEARLEMERGKGRNSFFCMGISTHRRTFLRVWGAPHNRALLVSRLGKALAKS
mgnify:CR=1 FL=1